MASSPSRYDIGRLAGQFRGQPITIVGNGPTGQAFQPTREDKWVWTINNGFMRIPGADLTFVMDDFESPAWRAHRQREEWFRLLRESQTPIVTTREHEDYPAAVAYPLKEVLEQTGGIGYFAETLTYMIAWAVSIPVASISFHGCDYYESDRRNQRACTEFWIGRAVSAGIHITVNPHSKLMVLPQLDYVNRHVPGFYGYIANEFPIPLGDNGTEAPADVRSDEASVQQAAQEAGL